MRRVDGNPHYQPYRLGCCSATTVGTTVQLTATIASGEDASCIATGHVTEGVPFVLGYYTVFNVEQCDGLILPT